MTFQKATQAPPVLRESDLTAIGVHVYGGIVNSASVIGIYGNQFLDYVAAFDIKAKEVKLPGGALSTTPGIRYVQIPTAKTPDVNNKVIDLGTGQFSNFSTQTGFQNVSTTSVTQPGFNQNGFTKLGYKDSTMSISGQKTNSRVVQQTASETIRIGSISRYERGKL